MDDKRELQRGWTTGACATAAAKAAFIGLITKKIPSEIRIKLPGGQIPILNAPAPQQPLLAPRH